MRAIILGLLAGTAMATGGLAFAKEDSSTKAAHEHRRGADQRTQQARTEQRRTETRSETRRTESYSSSKRR